MADKNPKQKTLKTKAFTLLEKLRNYYMSDEPSMRLMDAKEEELRKAIQANGVQDLPEILLIVKEAELEVDAINQLILNDKKLTEIERRALMAERDVHEFYLDRFSHTKAKATIKAVEDFLQSHADRIDAKK